MEHLVELDLPLRSEFGGDRVGHRPEHKLDRQVCELGRHPLGEYVKITDSTKEAGPPDEFGFQRFHATLVEQLGTGAQRAPEPPNCDAGAVDDRLTGT